MGLRHTNSYEIQLWGGQCRQAILPAAGFQQALAASTGGR
jgi:hypothetical protein